MSITIKSYFKHISHLFKGFRKTFFAKSEPYKDEFWDRYYKPGVSDCQTIYNTRTTYRDILISDYHYRSTEAVLLRVMINHSINLFGKTVLDLGSGAGHWIRFYVGLGADRVDGVDISADACEHLEEKYKAFDKVSITHSGIKAHLESLSEKYDVISGIGVIFHIIDDSEWEEVIQLAAKRLKPGGLLFVGGHFWRIPTINTQHNIKNVYNKRLRSRFKWKRLLKKSGFKKVSFNYNSSYLGIVDRIPENNILLAKLPES